MDSIHVKNDEDVINSVERKKKDKKRKNNEMSDFNGEDFIEEGINNKKKKTKVSSSNNSEGVSEVAFSSAVDKSSRKKEKKKKKKKKKDIVSKIDDNEEEDKSPRKEKKKKKKDIISKMDNNEQEDKCSRKEEKKKKKDIISKMDENEQGDKSPKKEKKKKDIVNKIDDNELEDKSSRKEEKKKKKDKISKMDDNGQEGDRKRKGKIDNGETGDREGMKKKKKEKCKVAEFDDTVASVGSVVNQTGQEVNEAVELVEGKKRKKKKGSKDLGDISLEKERLNGKGGEKDSGNRGDERKDESVKSMMNGEVNANASEPKGIKSVKEKKRKKRNRDDPSADKNTLISDGEKSRDRGRRKNLEDSVGLNAEIDENAGILKRNERSETADTSEKSHCGKKLKKVKFSENVEVFYHPDISNKGERNHENGNKDKTEVKGSSEKKEIGDDGLIRGKRFSKEEDGMIRNAVFKFIEDYQLGEEGLEMVLHCKSYSEIKHCWREIGEALPWRPYEAVYNRAHILFEQSEERIWTEEEIEILKEFYKKHGPDWKTLSIELGKHRFHVKDAWRRYKFPNLKKGCWAQEEYEKLFHLVNLDLSMKVVTEKKSKYGMLRDNISWGAISDKMETRTNNLCCGKWYYQLSSPMVAEGNWANGDDYRLLIALNDLDAACEEEVNWDDLLEHRSGDFCRKRWNQMIRHIGENATKQFNEQVEILSQRYCPDLLEAREEYDNRPAVD